MMHIHAWTFHGYKDYQKSVYPALSTLLKAFGGNSIYAELSITETIKQLAPEDSTCTIHMASITDTLRIVIACKEGAFPIRTVRARMDFVAQCKELCRLTWPSLPKRILRDRAIWRILLPVECAIANRDGKRMILYFCFPFQRKGASHVLAMREKLFVEDGDRISR